MDSATAPIDIQRSECDGHLWWPWISIDQTVLAPRRNSTGQPLHHTDTMPSYPERKARHRIDKKNRESPLNKPTSAAGLQWGQGLPLDESHSYRFLLCLSAAIICDVIAAASRLDDPPPTALPQHIQENGNGGGHQSTVFALQLAFTKCLFIRYLTAQASSPLVGVEQGNDADPVGKDCIDLVDSPQARGADTYSPMLNRLLPRYKVKADRCTTRRRHPVSQCPLGRTEQKSFELPLSFIEGRGRSTEQLLSPSFGREPQRLPDQSSGPAVGQDPYYLRGAGTILQRASSIEIPQAAVRRVVSSIHKPNGLRIITASIAEDTSLPCNRRIY
jgi:hypothetical protein